MPGRKKKPHKEIEKENISTKASRGKISLTG